MKTFANLSSPSSEIDKSEVMEHSSKSLNPLMDHLNSELPSDGEEMIVSIKEPNNGEKTKVQMTLDSEGDLYRAIKTEFKDITDNEFCGAITDILDDQKVIQFIVHRIKSLNGREKETTETKKPQKNEWHLKKLNSRKRKIIREKINNKEVRKCLENKDKKVLFNKNYRLDRMSKDAKKIKAGSQKMTQLIPSIVSFMDRFISIPNIFNIESLLIELWSHVKISKDNFDNWDLVFTDKNTKLNTDDKKFIIKQLNLYVGIRDFFRKWDMPQDSQKDENEQIELQEEQKVNYEESKIIKKRDLKKKFEVLYEEIKADFEAEKELNRKKNIKDFNEDAISL